MEGCLFGSVGLYINMHKVVYLVGPVCSGPRWKVGNLVG